MFKYFLFWFPMLLLAIINGTARDLWYKKYIGELAGHQLSTITLMILFGIYIYIIITKYPPVSGGQALLIGLLWLVLTLAFEFGFGRYRGKAWSVLLEDYNILRGRLWVLILVWISIAPYIFYRARH